MKASKSVIEKYKTLIYQYSDTYPELSISKLAKKLIKDEDITRTHNAFRQQVAALLNEREQKRRNNTDIDVIFGDADVEKDDIYIPRSWAKERPKFIIPNSIRRMLIISDMQMPFHEPEAIRTAIKYGIKQGMDAILLNGDIADCVSISKFIKNPEYRNLKQELDIVSEFLKKLRDKFPRIKMFYKEGNHEERVNTYVWNHPELYGIEELQLQNLLKLPELQIEYITDRRIILYGKLVIIHGHEIMGGGINVSRSFRIKARDNILFGHFHRWQQEVVPTIKGKQQGAWSTGCLCNLSPDYMTVNDWVNGFAFVTREKDGYFDVQNIRIINGLLKYS